MKKLCILLLFITSLNHLNSMEQIQVQEINFKCPFQGCNKKFKTNKDLKRHILFNHSLYNYSENSNTGSNSDEN